MAVAAGRGDADLACDLAEGERLGLVERRQEMRCGFHGLGPEECPWPRGLRRRVVPCPADAITAPSALPDLPDLVNLLSEPPPSLSVQRHPSAGTPV